MVSNEVKLKTKLEKHANDNVKRCQAINEKIKTKLSQAQIIKQALSTGNLHKNSINNINNVNNGKLKSSNENNNQSLFDGSSSDDENIEIKEKPQFAGKQGFKLLQLQSTYGNDERFKVDEKFLDVEEENEENYNIDDVKNQETNDSGSPLKAENANKSKKRKFEMIRYDSSIQDHEKYEIKDSVSNNEIPVKKKKKKKTNEDIKKEVKPKIVEVSKEKFFTVSKDITKSFKENKESAAGSFSLLQTYGETREENLDCASDEKMDEEKFTETNNKLEPHKQEKQEESANVPAIAQGIWKESFFFSVDDPRLKGKFFFKFIKYGVKV
ncbi:conserved hypothetical protein [Pediculus humanus corporis]|uniref:Uncharacterized protein n=1 Tax=Pediculus humanus subsp. corporis TaxID=121224 RepID=E0VSB5_PEDHC|nr:uncharacterized protein Phum_PHUM415010 [Pediculus humanus corporis]EEB16271.1 conserved hypothetical protein [Pediculus humanus corporis]